MTQLALLIAGAGALVAGCWLVATPLALIVGGSLIILFAVGWERGRA